MNSLKKDYFWNTIGVLLQNVISPVLLLVVTRVNGIEVAGLFSFAFSMSLLLYALGMWGGRTYQVSDVEKKFQPRSYVMVRVLLAVLVLVVATVFCVANQYDAYKTSIIFALVVFKLLESFADVLYGILQTNNQLYKSGRSLAVKSILGMVAFVAIDLLTDDILLGTLGIVVVNAIVFFCYDFPQTNKLEKISFPKAKIREYVNEAKEILKRCANVFTVMFLAMFSLNVPRYFIDQYSQAEVGYFGIIAMPITLIVLMITFILQPNIVTISKQYNDGKIADFKRSVSKIIGLSVAIGLVVLMGTVLAGVPLLQLIFGVDFSGHAIALNVIVAGGIASALVTVYLNIFVIMRKVNFSLIVLIVTNLILIPVSYFAVNSAGLMGGVMAFALTNFVQLALILIYFNLTQRKGSYEKN